MLDDAFGIASMNVDMGTGIGNEQRMPEVPNDEAPKFYRLLKEYQEPLMTTLRGYSKGQHQLLQQKEMQKQQQIIQEQAQRIKELEEMQEQHKKELEKIREQNKKELLEQQQHAMDVFKQEMMDMFARRVE
ncbi:hypothetical protein RIF29_04408 [Crotalaria pallida]|uniref:Uncharacterized protein n=1 Tax=Crotalaria pallida TaxID=3830 RepID=A0AAN9P977_CROPI